jgi:hypothetical protein
MNIYTDILLCFWKLRRHYRAWYIPKFTLSQPHLNLLVMLFVHELYFGIYLERFIILCLERVRLLLKWFMIISWGLPCRFPSFPCYCRVVFVYLEVFISICWLEDAFSMQDARVSQRQPHLRLVFHRLMRTVVLIILFEVVWGERPNQRDLKAILKFYWLVKQHNTILIFILNLFVIINLLLILLRFIILVALF